MLIHVILLGGVGVPLMSFHEAALAIGLQDSLLLTAVPATRTRCSAAAQKHFSLMEGVRRNAWVNKQSNALAGADSQVPPC